MALTQFQINVLRLLTENRVHDNESYIAGGAALNQILRTRRKSNDLDLFHDTTEALQITWNDDKKTLINNGYTVKIEREAISFVEAEISRGKEHLLIQWVRDSAFRFFPLVKDTVLGYTLHPFDLATNKLCAMAGRLEPRDWIDTIECQRHVQPLGYLIWAACGKDPGINPHMLLNDAARLHYSQQEIDSLDFDGSNPSAIQLSIEWKETLKTASAVIADLPEDHFGECILTDSHTLYKGTALQFATDLHAGKIVYRKGSIKGVWPEIIG
jgi:hypothetical protein